MRDRANDLRSRREKMRYRGKERKRQGYFPSAMCLRRTGSKTDRARPDRDSRDLPAEETSFPTVSRRMALRSQEYRLKPTLSMVKPHGNCRGEPVLCRILDEGIAGRLWTSVYKWRGSLQLGNHEAERRPTCWRGSSPFVLSSVLANRLGCLASVPVATFPHHRQLVTERLVDEVVALEVATLDQDAVRLSRSHGVCLLTYDILGHPMAPEAE
jgi:hypothetical protein